jgi:uncharacterized protein
MNIRHLDSTLSSHFDTYHQALILLGARQVGKTTLLRRLFPDAHYLLLDNQGTKEILESYDIHTYRQILGSYKTIILDELHLLTNPGRAVKIIYDQMPELKLIITGSSSLHIRNKTSESMAGRKIDYHLYPLTFAEYLYQTQISPTLDSNLISRLISNSPPPPRLYQSAKIIPNALIYGLYPELVTLPQDIPYLHNLADSVVFRDILELNLIDNQAKAKQLLQLLAYQIGSLISYAELANKIGIDQRTIKRYIEIFEQSYIIYRLYPYSTRTRNELTKSPKIYFWDLGLRNALINNFDILPVRPDSGALFENFVITEVAKLNSYTNANYQLNYWRTKSGSEIDLVLSKTNSLHGFEIKLNKGKITPAFHTRYPHATTRLITLNNFY